MATLRQIRANSENARLNTGERSSGGAGNARTHGLTASKCLSQAEKELIDARLAELECELKPEGQLQKDEVLLMAGASVRLERCLLEEQDWRLVRSERAEFFWDADRQQEARKLAEALPKRPALILARLLQQLRGCRIVLEGLRELAGRVRGASASDALRPLDEKGRRRAFDLLGLNEDCRHGSTPLDPPDGATSEAAVAAHQDALIAARIAELEALVGEDRVAQDESNRVATVHGAGPGVDDQTRLIRRYETEARQVKEQAHERLKALQAEAAARKRAARENEIERRAWTRCNLAKAEASAALAAEEQEPPKPTPTPPPPAPVEPVEATEATLAPASPVPTWNIDDMLADTATVGVRFDRPSSFTEPLSRRARKAAARAADRAIG